ncbi:MAG: enoyl-CoA hydratase [Candidatus Lokiarchaeota archaeon]|nr:enoyl-CoA hydratase [Candidatus Lokiarchaeota archaeon]
MTEEILTKLENNVLHIILNRPLKKNAITDEMYAKFGLALSEGEADSNVKVYLVYGSGDCFCAGKDIKDFQDMNRFTRQGENPSASFMNAIIEAKKPIIGAIHGYAVGIGATMLLHFDLLYAATGTKFRFPFTNLGLVPEFGSTLILPSILGKFKASELFLLADFFTAEDAYKMGLITQIFQKETLMEEVISLAIRLAEKPNIALIKTKQLLKKNYTTLLLERISEEGMEFAKRQASPEAQEAFRAFFEKRKPNFSKFE